MIDITIDPIRIIVVLQALTLTELILSIEEPQHKE